MIDFLANFFPRLFRFYLQPLDGNSDKLIIILFIGWYYDNYLIIIVIIIIIIIIYNYYQIYLIVAVLVRFVLTVFFETTMTQNMTKSSVGKEMLRPFLDCFFFFTSKHLTYKPNSFKYSVTEYYRVWSGFDQNLVPYHRICLIYHSLTPPPPLSAAGGVGGPPTKFSKREGLAGPQLQKGDCWKRGGNFFRGEGWMGGCNFYKKIN